MDDYVKELIGSDVFAGLSEADACRVLDCALTKRQIYPSGSYIMHEGDRADYAGIILSGEVSIVFNDFWGNRALVGKLQAGEIFGDAYYYSPDKTIHINVLASADTDVLIIDYEKFISPCANNCECHNKVIRNLLGMFANKLTTMMRKMTFVSKRTLREKIMTYLSTEARLVGSNTITITLSRQELADYLHIDRSALSRELGNMQTDGLIDYYKNSFKLIKNTAT